MGFKDYFSKQSSSYSVYRPKTPKELFSFLSSLCANHHIAWDVGTGNGQAALELAPYFEKVIATDASEEQINHAEPHPKVHYHVALAETADIVPRTIDLITAAQAVHWFDIDVFYKKVKKVATPGAIIALWTYVDWFINPEVDKVSKDYYHFLGEKYWPPERKLVEDHYKTIPFPFEEIKAPVFEMIEERNLQEWCGYLYTWSATQNMIKERGEKDFENLVEKLAEVWGDPETKLPVRWPLHMRVGRV